MLNVKSHFFTIKNSYIQFFNIHKQMTGKKKTKKYMQKQSTNIQPPKSTIHKYTNIQCNKPKTHNLSKEMKQTKQAKKKRAN